MGGRFVDIDAHELRALIDRIGPTEKQVDAALRSTYGKMAKWIQTRAVRGLSSKLKIQQKILRRRVRTFRLQGGVGAGSRSGQAGHEGAKVWFGLNPIPFASLKPRRSKKGIAAMGGRYVEGAFFGMMFGKTRVLKRTTKARHPLEVVKAEIGDESAVYIEDHLVGTAEFDAAFFKILEHELKWRTQILK